MDINNISETVKKVVKEVYQKNKINTIQTISLSLAEKLIKEVELEAVKRNMKVVIAVANAGGNIVAVHAMDDSFIASYNIAVNKAWTCVSLKMPTKALSKLANPNGGSLYGIQNTDPRIVIFGGGEPLIINGNVVGSVAVSGGTAEQDTSLGEFAEKKFKEILLWL